MTLECELGDVELDEQLVTEVQPNTGPLELLSEAETDDDGQNTEPEV